MMLISFGVILAAFSLYIFSALFSRQYQAEFEPGTNEDLRLRKQEILTGLNDLEYDFQMKKMKEEDYRQEKEKLMADGAKIIQKIEANKPAPAASTKKKRSAA